MKRERHQIQNVFIFLLLGLFAALSTLTVLLGAQTYQRIVRRSDAQSMDRILRAFVRGAAQAEDAAGSVFVEEIDGVRMLTLTSEIDGEEYTRRIYCYDGALRERFTSAGRTFDPELGETICAAQTFDPRIEGGLLTVYAAGADGEPCEVCVALRSAAS